MRLKIQTAKRHFPPRRAEPSNRTVWEVQRNVVTFQLLSPSCKRNLVITRKRPRINILSAAGSGRAQERILQRKAVPCTVDLRKGCRMHKIKEAAEPPLLSFCQQQLTECLAVTLDINQSSDLVQ